MPLLNKQRVPLAPNIPYDPKRQRKEVWELRFTNELFTSYEYPFFKKNTNPIDSCYFFYNP